MLHRPSSSLGKVQCLDMLAAYETAWRTLSWSGNAPVEILNGWGEPVAVSGNVIAFPKPDAPLRELLLVRVPSKFRDVTMKSWKVQLAHDVRDVCIDSAQDLLVCYRGYVPDTGVSHFHPHVCFTLELNRFISVPFYREKCIHLCSMLASSSLRTVGSTVLGVCVSVATIWPLRLSRGCIYPSGIGSLASTYPISCVLFLNRSDRPST